MKNLTMTVALSAPAFLPVRSCADKPVVAALNQLERASKTGLDDLFANLDRA